MKTRIQVVEKYENGNLISWTYSPQVKGWLFWNNITDDEIIDYMYSDEMFTSGLVMKPISPGRFVNHIKTDIEMCRKFLNWYENVKPKYEPIYKVYYENTN